MRATWKNNDWSCNLKDKHQTRASEKAWSGDQRLVHFIAVAVVETDNALVAGSRTICRGRPKSLRVHPRHFSTSQS